MTILQTAKNGVATQYIKTKEELNSEEKAGAMKIARGTEYEHYESFKIWRNKKNELLYVKGHKMTEEYEAELKVFEKDYERIINSLRNMTNSAKKERCIKW